MKKISVFLLFFVFVAGSAVQGGQCNRRGCTPQDDPQSLEYAQNRLETVVNAYFNQMMDSLNLSAAEMEDRHNKIILWARANSGRAPIYLMDAWEAELDMKMRILSVGDPQFANNFPTVVRSAVENYYTKKLNH